MMANRRSFFLITTWVFGGLAVVFWGLYQREVEKDLMPSGTEVIGKIVQSDLDVSRRLNSRLLWSPLDGDSIVYRKDTIRTGPNSGVIVRLNDQSSIALGENTLVVLETENESLSLKLADGDVEFSGNITVALDGNTKLRAVNGTMRLKRDLSTGKDKVAAMSGQAQVVTDGKVSIVERGEVLVKGQEGAFKMSSETVEDAGLRDLGLKNIEKLEMVDDGISVKLSALEPKASVVKDSGANVVRLSWTAPKEASKYLVKIGQSEYSVLETKFDISLPDLAPRLSESITVQAVGSGAAGVAQVLNLDSATKDVVMALGLRPHNRMPFQGSRILAQKKQIILNWSDAELKHQDFLHYTVKVKKPNSDDTKEFKSKLPSLDFEFEQSGIYSWSVQAQFKGWGPGLASAITSFEVVGGADLAAPTISPASEDN